MDELLLHTEAERLEQLAQQLGALAERGASLARYAMVSIGGPADVLVVARNRDDLLRVLGAADALALSVKVFGGLTNCLISDDGLPGWAVIVNQLRGYRFDGDLLYAEAGANVVQIAREAVKRGLGGLTWAVGLPGTVGGMVINNAGAFGGETAKTLVAAEAMGPDGLIHEVTPDWFDFSYRRSCLKGVNSGWVVLSATFQLRPGDPEKLQAKAEEYTQRRQAAQPPGKTLGSTFKNPPDDYAGRLIEAAGLKGARVGGIVVSERHANFFINDQHGTARDFKDLLWLVQAEVKRQFGVQLEPEIELVG